MTATLISLLAVTFGFVGLVLWVYWPSHKQELESLGQIPLDDSGLELADSHERIDSHEPIDSHESIKRRSNS
jgi:cbb3-type cytochrome oxidase subunit 3